MWTASNHPWSAVLNPRPPPLTIAQHPGQGFHILLPAAPEQAGKLFGVDRRDRIGRLAWARPPLPPSLPPSQPPISYSCKHRRNAASVSNFPNKPVLALAPRRHLPSAALASLGMIGATGEPGPIFCRLPVMTRSVSLRPVTLTSSPSVGPSFTSFCSALLSAPTT
jgi:hypothetical protein